LFAPLGRCSRIAALAASGFLFWLSPAAADDASLAAAAFAAGDRGSWSEARSLAAQASDPLVWKLVLWQDVTRPQGGGGFTEITGFLVDNPDWPSQRTMKLRAENGLDDGTGDAAVIAWFERNEPLTLRGANRFAYALINRGENARAMQVARTAWATADAQSVDEEDTFFIGFRDVLTPEDSARRLDRLLWAGRTAPAQRLLPRLDPGTAALGEARIALRQNSEGAPGLVTMVPAEMQGDPGLIYDQVRWYRRKGSDAYATQLLTQYQVDSAQPEQFWQERSQLARQALTAGDANGAYAVASRHGFVEGSELGDSEWLAGWIALRFLQQPELAQRNFLAMFDNVRHPVSRARGAYWSARAATALGDPQAALLWHKAAAQHSVAFYGQLSAAVIRPGEPLRLPPDPVPNAEEAARFQNHELVRAIRLLAATGERDSLRTFLLRLADLNDSPAWKDMAATLANEVDRPEVGVAIARQSVRLGTPLVRNGYPILPIGDIGQSPVELPLIHAIVRQESAFDMRAVSPAGAQGLMQLMPGTAREVSSKLGIPYSPSELTSSVQYNISLGSAYVGGLVDRFDGSYILALAGYNAGPGRANQWIRSNGDPRSSTEAAVDWIEMIPFTETRNYVQRCMENLQVYRARLGGTQLAQSPAADPLR